MTNDDDEAPSIREIYDEGYCMFILDITVDYCEYMIETTCKKWNEASFKTAAEPWMNERRGNVQALQTPSIFPLRVSRWFLNLNFLVG